MLFNFLNKTIEMIKFLLFLLKIIKSHFKSVAFSFLHLFIFTLKFIKTIHIFSKFQFLTIPKITF